jgi:hypothetical protein
MFLYGLLIDMKAEDNIVGRMFYECKIGLLFGISGVFVWVFCGFYEIWVRIGLRPGAT